jgi:hypothetical protein
VNITTTDSSGDTIDGPTTSLPVKIKQIGESPNDISSYSIQPYHISQGFIYTVEVRDDSVGHAVGWFPYNPATSPSPPTDFFIKDPNLTHH